MQAFPLLGFTAGRTVTTSACRIRQMIRRPRCVPQFNRSPPCPLAIWLHARS
jgi:hypothetical protein